MKYEDWKDQLESVFDVAPTKETFEVDSSFRATLTSNLIGQLIVIHSRSAPMEYKRTTGHIVDNFIDHILIELVVSGPRLLISDSGESHNANIGDINIYDLAQPYTLKTTLQESSFCEDICIVLPRNQLNKELQYYVSDLHLHTIQKTENTNIVLSSQIKSLMETADFLNEQTALALNSCFASIFTNILENYQTQKNQRKKTMVKVDTIFDFVEREFSNPALDITLITSELHISKATLYRLCEPWGGISKIIRKRRLLKAYKLLFEATTNSSISEIAYDCGFSNPDSFTRAFKKEFSISPSNVIKASKEDSNSTHLAVLAELDQRNFVNWAKYHL